MNIALESLACFIPLQSMDPLFSKKITWLEPNENFVLLIARNTSNLV